MSTLPLIDSTKKITTLVVGASGATGRLLVAELLKRGQNVKVIVRSPDKLSATFKHHDNLSVINANLLDLSDDELAHYVSGCHAVVSCLGHTMSFKGIFGHPRRLVSKATHRLYDTIKTHTPSEPVKFVLMNTAGNSNRDLQEPISLGHGLVISLLRFLLPPHADNEEAADYLRTKIDRKGRVIEWVVVRPDSLLNEESVSDYEVFTSPTRSAIFNPGKTSRINVAHFMADLITNEDIWQKWKGQMPVIYNKPVS